MASLTQLAGSGTQLCLLDCRQDLLDTCSSAECRLARSAAAAAAAGLLIQADRFGVTQAGKLSHISYQQIG